MSQMGMHKAAPGVIVQFAKAPNLGRVKTRMQPVLSPEQSRQLHMDLVRHTYGVIQALTAAQVSVAVSDIDHPYWQSEGIPECCLWLQPNGDLGQRMFACFEHYLQVKGHPWVLIVGSDCPAISAEYLAGAIVALERGEALVIGPATDGGYVLIGMALVLPVFHGVDWGSERVLMQTCALAEALGVKPYLLESLPDIDRPDDLMLLQAYPTLRYWVDFIR